MITRIVLKDYHAIDHLSISGLKTCNIFCGKNNSGKTTILECSRNSNGVESFRVLARITRNQILRYSTSRTSPVECLLEYSDIEPPFSRIHGKR